MKRTISYQSIQIPFKTKFSHSSASREVTETIIVMIENENGLFGYGESCPRSYVTGESISSAGQFISKMTPTLSEINSLADLEKYQNDITPEIDQNPSAWCALEMAMLDLIAKENKTSVEVLLNLNSTEDKKPFSAVVGIDTFSKLLIKVLLYKLMGFSDFKLKLSGQRVKDQRALSLISFFSKAIRVDANNLFKSADEAIDYLMPLKKYFWAIEEPVSAFDFESMKKIALILDVKIILDESFLNSSTSMKIKDQNELYIPNIRISKLGGILRTLKIIQELEANKFQWILGSHVGEMSLLTRASILVSRNHDQNLIAKEGGFSTHLLSYDPFFPNLKLSFGAKIKNATFKNKLGFGMNYIRKTK